MHKHLLSFGLLLGSAVSAIAASSTVANLPAASTPLTGAETFYCVQSGVDSKCLAWGTTSLPQFAGLTLATTYPYLNFNGTPGQWQTGIDSSNHGGGLDWFLAKVMGPGVVADILYGSNGGVVATTMGAAASGSTTLQVASTAGIVVGQDVNTVAGLANAPVVSSITDGTHVVVSQAQTIANGTAIFFFQEPTFGMGVTPSKIKLDNHPYGRLQVSTATDEPGMGGIESRVASTQTGPALFVSDSNNVVQWGVNSDFTINGETVKDAASPSTQLWGLETNATTTKYAFYFNGTSLRWSYITGSKDIFQFGTDGTVYTYQKQIALAPAVDQSYNRQVPTTGFSITPAGTVSELILDPAATLASGTITMPATAGIKDGQIFGVSSSQIVTALTMQANTSQTLIGGLTTIGAGGFARWQWDVNTTTWYRIG